MIFLENKRKSSERVGEFWGIVGGNSWGIWFGVILWKRDPLTQNE